MRHATLIAAAASVLTVLSGCFLVDDYHEEEVIRDAARGSATRRLPPAGRAETPPPPLSGGTMLVSQVRDVAVVADPDTDQVHLVSLTAPAAHQVTLALSPGDEPGRVVESRDSYYVALRSGGAVLQLDQALGVVGRYDVCAAPRGLAVTPDALYVACRGGDFVTLEPATGAELARRRLGDDLRDVVVSGEHIYVSHFRRVAVSMLRRDGDGEVETFEVPDIVDGRGGSFDAAVAYRMIGHAGKVLLLHQLARSQEQVRISSSGGYGGRGCSSPGLVQAALTVIDGSALSTTQLGALVLPLDVSVDAGTDDLMIAAAGNRTDLRTVRPVRAAAAALGNFRNIEGQTSSPLGCQEGVAYTDGRRVTAVGHTRLGRRVILTRAPTQVHVVDTSALVALPGPEVYDMGHDLFFGDAGAGIACASCHAEGGEDGLVWSFEGIGARRTQDLRGGLLGTEPFHWNGDMENFWQLSNEVFSRRMGGPIMASQHVDALAGYIDTLTFPEHGQDLDPLAVSRGRAIFESEETECASCHSGPRLTGPGSFDVGTGGRFQVPSLLGVGMRAPFIHSGCAETMEARFDAECGGATHGRVDHLAPAQLDDLVAYLESI